MITDEMIGAACIAAFGTMTPILRERAKRALEAAERAAWQPIETVPDNTVVILGWEHCGEWISVMDKYSWVTTEEGEEVVCRNGFATEWRPLPEPPEDAP